MPSLNEHTILGHLGKDPEVKYTKDGKAVANLSVATSERWKKDDQWHERTEWHRIVVWGKGAEWASENLSKGDLVMVKAPSRTREWEDKDGVKRYTTEVVCTMSNHLIPVSYTKTKTEKTEAERVEPSFDDDIPF